MFEYLKKDEPQLIQRNYEKVIGEDELKLSAKSSSGFGSWKIRNELPTWCSRNNPIKKSGCFITVTVFKGFCGVKQFSNEYFYPSANSKMDSKKPNFEKLLVRTKNITDEIVKLINRRNFVKSITEELAAYSRTHNISSGTK